MWGEESREDFVGKIVKGQGALWTVFLGTEMAQLVAFWNAVAPLLVVLLRVVELEMVVVYYENS